MDEGRHNSNCSYHLLERVEEYRKLIVGCNDQHPEGRQQYSVGGASGEEWIDLRGRRWIHEVTEEIDKRRRHSTVPNRCGQQ